MKVAFTGCRHTDVSPTAIMGYVNPGVTVLVGDCPTGVDRCVRKWCESQGIEPIVYRARWSVLMDGAGPERNQRMVEDADRLVAFWNGKSPGTKDCIIRAVRCGVPVSIQPIGQVIREQMTMTELA